MAEITVDADGTVRQDGQTAEEWVKSIFEHELCSECGYDYDKHTVCRGPFGLFFARCDNPIPETLSDDEFDAELHHRLMLYDDGASTDGR